MGGCPRLLLTQGLLSYWVDVHERSSEGVVIPRMVVSNVIVPRVVILDS